MIEFDETVIAQDRRDALHAEFSRFLHDEVHAFAPRDSLYEVNLERRLGRRFNLATDSQGHTVFADLFDRCRPLSTIGIEYLQRIADPRAQYATQVTSLLILQNELRIVAQCAGNK